MLVKDFNHTIDVWMKALQGYNFLQLCAKPSPDSWSVGQVYMHLIGETNYYLQQIHVCLSTNDNADKEMTPDAKAMFKHNDFPDEIIEGPPTNANTKQPENKEELIRSLMNLKRSINSIEISISKSAFKGKAKHPGFDYLNAREWLQFAEMHFRHHLRQKKRIDAFLKENIY
jgi:DinB superfamily